MEGAISWLPGYNCRRQVYPDHGIAKIDCVSKDVRFTLDDGITEIEPRWDESNECFWVACPGPFIYIYYKK